jgi:hypothetical protein
MKTSLLRDRRSDGRHSVPMRFGCGSVLQTRLPEIETGVSGARVGTGPATLKVLAVGRPMQ